MSEKAISFDATRDENGDLAFVLPDGVRHAQIRRAFKAGAALTVRVEEFQATRSGRQNRGFHAMVTPWAKERGWRIEALKQFLLKQVFGVLEFTDPKTGEVIEVLAEPHTSSLSVAKFSELIEATLELAAEDGMFLTAPDEYRQQREKAMKRAAKKAQAA